LDGLTLFGAVAVSAMLVTYALESKSHWYVLAFAGACLASSTYGFLQGAWPFGVVEAVWSVVALRRWLSRRAGR
jgi:presenilin-like A22 family membrane protease